MLESFNSGAFEYQKLSPEEQKRRGILGRLVGIIADTKNPTRNGRKYSAQLWENVFNNPIMKEKIKNRCCFGELCHPEDRTEVDMQKIAICLAETPKKGPDGKLYGVLDILDTPNGRILKTLCDYGCNIGISSRGQGDLITDDNGDEAVDPDTYECECFDAVVIPAVESARLRYVTESLHSNEKGLKKALTESLESANEEAKKVMEETLEALNININESEDDISDEEYKKAGFEFVEKIKGFTPGQAKHLFFNEYEFDKHAPEDDVEQAIFDALQAKMNESLTEAAEDESEPAPEEVEASEEKIEEPENEEEKVEIAAEEESIGETPANVDAVMDDLTVDEEEAIDAYDKAIAEIEAMDVLEKDAVLDIIRHIREEEQEHIDEIDDARAVAAGEKAPEEVEVEETEIEEEPAEEEPNDESHEDKPEESNEGDEPLEEAVDNGDEKLINTLTEALRNKVTLESEIKTLHEKLAVSDAKVNTLLEEIERYKKAVARLASISKANADLKENVSKLEESLAEKTATIEEQKTRITRLVTSRKQSVTEALSLNESIEAKTGELATLNESLEQVRAENTRLTEMLTSEREKAQTSLAELNESLSKETALKEGYKKLANKAVNKYIEMKANMLGLTSVEIKRKLGESYTLTDVDQVCEELKAVQLNVSRLPFNTDSRIGVKVNESVRRLSSKKPNAGDDDDIDDTLMRLANLK